MPAPHASATVPDEVRDRVAARATTARVDLDGTIERRRRVHERLTRSPDPDDQLVARAYLDFLHQADEVRRSGAALTLAAGPTGDPVVGRMAVFDGDREVSLVSWHSPAGQAQLLADDRLLVSEHGDGSLSLHTLQADDRVLADRIRQQMRTSALQDRMSDPLATLTVEQAAVLRRIGAASGDVVLHGPPGSGKSAIVMVELARRVLSDPAGSHFRALFVTGTERLARRAESLGRLLGTASITPVPQDRLLAFLGLADGDTPAADDDRAAGGLVLPMAVEDTFTRLAGRLYDDVEIPHPLGSVPAGDVAAVRQWRARGGSTGYRALRRGLASDLRAEYEAIWPGEPSQAAAEAATQALRPALTPSDLLARASGDRGLPPLPRPLRTAALSAATELLDRPGGRPEERWDLVVVDEYQRLPGVAIWVLQRGAGRLVLSGDPMQSFASGDVPGGLAGATVMSLQTSLRLPDRLARWVDEQWAAAGLEPPAVRSAVAGGRIVEVPGDAALPEGAQVIAPAARAHGHGDWLTPLDAVGLEWPEVALVDPRGILDAHGPAGLFIAATRAIDTLYLTA